MEVSRRRGWYIHQVVCPGYLTKYHENMDGIDQDDQLRECCAGFSSKAQFKKCYKGGHLGFCGYSLLNSHIDCNMSCEQMVVRGVLMWEPLKK